jgi:hypothetical protein
MARSNIVNKSRCIRTSKPLMGHGKDGKIG